MSGRRASGSSRPSLGVQVLLSFPFKKCLGEHLEVPDIRLADIRGLLNRIFWGNSFYMDLCGNGRVKVRELRLEPPYTGVSRASGPEIPKKSQKGVPGRPGPECQKSVEKVPNDPKKNQKDCSISVRGLFRHFFDTPGRDAREHIFETFWEFRGSGVWRLLHMGIAIAIRELQIHPSSHTPRTRPHETPQRS